MNDQMRQTLLETREKEVRVIAEATAQIEKLEYMLDWELNKAASSTELVELIDERLAE